MIKTLKRIGVERAEKIHVRSGIGYVRCNQDRVRVEFILCIAVKLLTFFQLGFKDSADWGPGDQSGSNFITHSQDRLSKHTEVMYSEYEVNRKSQFQALGVISGQTSRVKFYRLIT